MSNAASFKDLHLDRNKIEECLFSISDCKISEKQKTDAQSTYSIIKDDKQITLNIYLKKNGTTSLLVQGNDELKNSLGGKICSKIRSKCSYYNISEINASIKVTPADFEQILKQLREKYNDNISEKEVNGGKSYIFEKSNEGKFVLNFYTKNNKLLLQGKPLKFFSEVMVHLTDLEYDPLTYVLKETQNIQLEEQEDLLAEFLPIIKNKIQLPFKKVITPSLQLMRTNINFPDYTIMVFPSLKTLEHIIIIALEKKGTIYTKENGFKDIFRRDSSRDLYYMPTEDKRVPTEGTFERKIGDCYTFFKKQRHGLFHAGEDIADIRIIEDKQEAINLLTECIELMEDIGDDI